MLLQTLFEQVYSMTKIVSVTEYILMKLIIF